MSEEEESFEFIGGSDALIRFLRQLAGAGRSASSNNPADYPRSVRITDQDVLSKIWRHEKNVEEYLNLKEKLDLLKAQGTALQKEIFMGLKTAYPEIDLRRRYRPGGVGWREHDESFYYVGWDGDEPTSKEE